MLYHKTGGGRRGNTSVLTALWIYYPIPVPSLQQNSPEDLFLLTVCLTVSWSHPNQACIPTTPRIQFTSTTRGPNSRITSWSSPHSASGVSSFPSPMYHLASRIYSLSRCPISLTLLCLLWLLPDFQNVECSQTSILTMYTTSDNLSVSWALNTTYAAVNAQI